jgi:hypothetical protein
MVTSKNTILDRTWNKQQTLLDVTLGIFCYALDYNLWRHNMSKGHQNNLIEYVQYIMLHKAVVERKLYCKI